MSICLTGSHRSGKTTLARAFAQYEGIPFVQTTASAVFESLGLSPSETLTMSKRLLVQRKILEEFERLYRSAKSRVFITDRSPIDLIGYTMVEIGQKPIGAKNERELYKYIDDCIDVLNRHFSTIVIVSPAIPLVAEEGKASLSKPFIDHLAYVLEGVCAMPNITAGTFRIPRKMIDLSDRVQSLSLLVDNQLKSYQENITYLGEQEGKPVVFH